METSDRVVRVGLPSGSLQEPTFALFGKAGFNISGASRSYRPAIDDSELIIRLLRAQEISRYVEHGFLDCGLTGKDWIANNGSDVAVLAEMTFSKASNRPTRWVIAVPEESSIRTVQDLEGKVIATEAVELTRQFLAKHGVTATIEFSWGATEVKVPDLVDAIVDVTETGGSLRANQLRVLETIMESSPQFIANRRALTDPWKRQKIERLVLLLQGAFAARDKVGLKMNLPEAKLAGLLAALPALRNPTVAQLAQGGWVAVETIIDERVVREIIPQLKALGAEGIIEYPLNKVVSDPPRTRGWVELIGSEGPRIVVARDGDSWCLRPPFNAPPSTPDKSHMGSLKKRRKAKIAKHKRRKRMKENRHKKRLRYKS